MNIMAGNMDKKRLKEMALARVVRLSFWVSLMRNVITLYSDTPEKPGGL
jgi:hypothetical protein